MKKNKINNIFFWGSFHHNVCNNLYRYENDMDKMIEYSLEKYLRTKLIKSPLEEWVYLDICNVINHDWRMTYDILESIPKKESYYKEIFQDMILRLGKINKEYFFVKFDEQGNELEESKFKKLVKKIMKKTNFDDKLNQRSHELYGQEVS